MELYEGRFCMYTLYYIYNMELYQDSFFMHTLYYIYMFKRLIISIVYRFKTMNKLIFKKKRL